MPSPEVLTQAALALWHRLSPHHRRIAAKRRLERLLLEYGLSDKRRATQIANIAYPKRSRP